jgi:hypothetical protein
VAKEEVGVVIVHQMVELLAQVGMEGHQVVVVVVEVVDGMLMAPMGVTVPEAKSGSGAGSSKAQQSLLSY